MTKACYKKASVSKRLQTELQATIAYASYDNNFCLNSGRSFRQKQLKETLYNLYMPSNHKKSDHVSYVQQFLSGKGVFQYLFERTISPQPVADNDGSASIGSSTCEVLSIPFIFHGETFPISIKSDCITMSLLTRKNLSNPADVTELSLFRHAKEVEANSKKALALCLSEESPYKSFNGTFPSGTNWHDYLT